MNDAELEFGENLVGEAALRQALQVQHRQIIELKRQLQDFLKKSHHHGTFGEDADDGTKASQGGFPKRLFRSLSLANDHQDWSGDEILSLHSLDNNEMESNCYPKKLKRKFVNSSGLPRCGLRTENSQCDLTENDANGVVCHSHSPYTPIMADIRIITPTPFEEKEQLLPMERMLVIDSSSKANDSPSDAEHSCSLIAVGNMDPANVDVECPEKANVHESSTKLAVDMALASRVNFDEDPTPTLDKLGIDEPTSAKVGDLENGRHDVDELDSFDIPSSFSTRFLQTTSFSYICNELAKHGWTWKFGKGLVQYLYLRPNKTALKPNKLNEDYFESESALMSFLLAKVGCRENKYLDGRKVGCNESCTALSSAGSAARKSGLQEQIENGDTMEEESEHGPTAKWSDEGVTKEVVPKRRSRRTIVVKQNYEKLADVHGHEKTAVDGAAPPSASVQGNIDQGAAEENRHATTELICVTFADTAVVTSHTHIDPAMNSISNEVFENDFAGGDCESVNNDARGLDGLNLKTCCSAPIVGPQHISASGIGACVKVFAIQERAENDDTVERLSQSGADEYAGANAYEAIQPHTAWTKRSHRVAAVRHDYGVVNGHGFERTNGGIDGMKPLKAGALPERRRKSVAKFASLGNKREVIDSCVKRDVCLPTVVRDGYDIAKFRSWEIPHTDAIDLSETVAEINRGVNTAWNRFPIAVAGAASSNIFENVCTHCDEESVNNDERDMSRFSTLLTVCRLVDFGDVVELEHSLQEVLSNYEPSNSDSSLTGLINAPSAVASNTSSLPAFLARRPFPWDSLPCGEW